MTKIEVDEKKQSNTCFSAWNRCSGIHLFFHVEYNLLFYRSLGIFYDGNAFNENIYGKAAIKEDQFWE